MSTSAHSPGDDDFRDRLDDDTSDGPDDDDSDDAERQARARVVMDELSESRRRIAEVPATQVIENHLIGLFELANIHLAAGPEHLREAALAIDALGAVVEGLAGRLGDNESLLVAALQQIRLTFVQVKGTYAS